MTSQSLTTTSSSVDTPAWRRFLASTLATSPALSPLFLRLALAVVIFPHGAQKLLGAFGGHGFSATIQFLGSVGLPAAVAALVILLEFFGPLLLVLGVATRWVALGMIGLMVGAIATVHVDYGFFMNWSGNQQGEGFEYHLLVIGIALALLAAGAGRLGLDTKLADRLR